MIRDRSGGREHQGVSLMSRERENKQTPLVGHLILLSSLGPGGIHTVPVYFSCVTTHK